MFTLFSSLLEADNYARASKDYDPTKGDIICASKQGDSMVGLGGYQLGITPNVTGRYPSGRTGNPDNWQEDEHPDMDSYDVEVEMFSIVIAQDKNKQFEVYFEGRVSDDDLQTAFIKLAQSGKVSYAMWSADDDGSGWDDVPESLHAALLDASKKYIESNGECYSQYILSNHVKIQ